MHILVLIFFVFIGYQNSIPEGYIIATGDIIPVFNYEKYFHDSTYAWSPEGLGSPNIAYAYYGYQIFIYILFKLLGLSRSQGYTIHLILQLYLAYISFYFCINKFNGKSDRQIYLYMFAIIYALNIYTYSILYSGWIYTPFYLLYVIIPYLFATTYSFFTMQKICYKSLAQCTIAFGLLNLAFGNIGYLVPTMIFTMCTTIFAYIRSVKDEFFIKKTIFYYGLFGLVTAYSIIPIAIGIYFDSSYFTSQQLSTGEWAASQTFPFKNLMFFQFSIAEIVQKNTSLAISALVMFIIFIWVTCLRKRGSLDANPNLNPLLIILTLVFMLLTSKGAGLIPDSAIKIIYSNLIFGSMRSYQKTVVFLPWIIIFTIALNCIQNKNSKHVLLLLSLSSLPVLYSFIIGGTLTKFHFDYAQGNGYQNSKYAPIVKPSEEITELQYHVDSKEPRILVLPYSIVDEKFGWRTNTSTKYKGTSFIYEQYFDNEVIDVNNISTFDGYNLGKALNESLYDPLALIFLAMRLNIGYIFYDSSIQNQVGVNEYKMISQLAADGYIDLIYNGIDLKLYKIKANLIAPKFILLDQSSSDANELHSINYKFLKYFNDDYINLAVNYGQYNKLIKKSEADNKLKYKMINPALYSFEAVLGKSNSTLNFNEKFNKLWILVPAFSDVRSFLYSMKYTYNILADNDKFAHFRSSYGINSWILDPNAICNTLDSICKNDYPVKLQFYVLYIPYLLSMFFATISIIFVTVAVTYLASQFRLIGMKINEKH